MTTRSCVRKHNLIVMPLGKFEFILGIDFLRKYQFFPFPPLDGMMVMNESNSGFRTGVHPFGKVGKVSKKKNKGMSFLLCQSTKG